MITMIIMVMMIMVVMIIMTMGRQQPTMAAICRVQ